MTRTMAVTILTGACAALFAEARAAPAAKEFSAQAVDEAIDRGVKYLWSRQSAKHHWEPYGSPTGHFYPVGPSALAAYALIETEVDPINDAKMAATLKWLGSQKTTKTYSLGLRANVWLAANTKTRGRHFRNELRQDAVTLARSTGTGAYTYESTGRTKMTYRSPTGPRGITPGAWDNSNTQYGLLGVWAASQADVEVPKLFWQLSWRHWASSQLSDGGWPYRNGGANDAHSAAKETMTVGGIASLFVCFDELYAETFTQCKGEDVSKATLRIKKGLDWLDKNFAKTIQGAPNYYYYYGIERVGLASGYKYFGTSDWYKLGAARLLQAQQPDGSWGGGVVNTSFALLFLIRGRNAVIFNKLDFGGDWNNRPRDLAMLTKWLSRTFERTVNWQIINLKVPVAEWHDAPILYISGAKAPKFSDDEIKNLRTFVQQGGAIFSATECNGIGFRKGIREVYAKLLPDYKLVEAPRAHEIYTKAVYFKLPAQCKFHLISNGVRPLVVHTDIDLPLTWQLRRYATQRWAFQAAANVAKYVTGAITLLRPRGSTHWPKEPGAPARRTIRLARLKHSGRYDPEPLAYERFRRMMAHEAKVRLEVVGPMAISDLAAAKAKVATLTGTGPLTLSEAEQKALKSFVEAGGALVVDAAGGDKEFADSAEKMLKTMYGSFKVRILSSSSLLYRQSGMLIRQVKYRPRTKVRLGSRTTAHLRGVLLDGGRVGVIFSREDLTAGLVGYPSYTVDGYHPDTAFELMRNIVVLADQANQAKTK